MASDSTGERTFVCPNCRALNLPGTLLCISCGVNLANFRAALPRIQALQEEHITLHHEQLAEDASAVLEAEVARGRERWRTQMKTLLGIAGLLTILVVIGSALYGYQQKMRREQLAAAYEKAQMCLAQADYQCARNELIMIRKEDPTYKGLLESLRAAHLGLARQYITSGQWESAIAELDTVLQEQPNNTEGLNLMKETYDRWMQDATGRGDLVTFFRVRLQRDARFAQK